ncbi:MAG: tRNA (adenosine(37)-N6)-dimethylallyltransferase MiaA [Candidatus Binatia bacterium]
MSSEPIIALVGPTGVGKTDLALQVAEHLGAEIVNADSRQVYRYLDIGSAKPTPAQQARVRHHLLDVVNPDEPFDCARYRELAVQAIADIEARHRRVLLVGGTGLYLKVLMGGLFPGPPRDPDLRRQLEADEQTAPGCLHERLQRLDAASARRLHPHDHVRIVRALEVALLTQRPISEWQAQHAFSDRRLLIVPIGLTLERALLCERINARCHAMIEAGLIDEVRGLWDRGFGADLPTLRSIGYGEIGAFLRGEMTLDAALEHMARATRQLAKRQLTWFRRTPGLRWLDARCTAAEIIAAAASQ